MANTYFKYSIDLAFRLSVITILLLMPGHRSTAQTVNTVAGVYMQIGSQNGSASVATFNNPHGIEIDRQGNIYIADRYNHLIRKIDSVGQVSIYAGTGIAGSADGPGTTASFKEPWGLTVDKDGNVWVADTKNNKIRKIDKNRVVTTVAGNGNFGITDSNNPLAASFGNPTGIAIDGKGNVYVGDHLTHLIRKIAPNGAVTTLAGDKNYPNNNGFEDGIGQSAKFYRPYGIEVDNKGNIYVADEWNHAIRKVSPLGVVTTLAGNGTLGYKNEKGKLALFNYPWDIALDTLGNVYVADGYNYSIRKIDLNGNVSLYAGIPGTAGSKDGEAPEATFNGATALSITSKNDALYVADAYNQLIRKINILQSLSAPKIAFEVPNEKRDTLKICPNEQVTIKVYGGYESYNFYRNDTLIMSSFDSSFTYPPTNGTKYIIKVKGIKEGYLNQNSNPLTVLIKKELSISLKPLIKVPKPCLGDSVVLSTLNGDTIHWNTGQVNSKITVKKPGQYFGLHTDPEEVCLVHSDTLQVDFAAIPQATISATPQAPYFEGDSILLLASGGNQYQWEDGSSGNPRKIGLGGDYRVWATDSNGCKGLSPVLSIRFDKKPLVLKVMYPEGRQLCIDDSISLKTSNGLKGRWYFNGKSMAIEDSMLSIKKPGLYFYQQSQDNIQYNSDTLVVLQSEKPQGNIEADITALTASQHTVTFTANTFPKNKVMWDFGVTTTDNDSSSSQHPQFSYTEPGVYSVSLHIIDTNQCSITLLAINLINYDIVPYIPTGFTPNGDGVNDEVRVRGLNTLASNVQFSIYNEWGEQVFSTVDIDQGWDGNYKGKAANIGNYSYLLQYQKDGKTETYKGIITLIK